MEEYNKSYGANNNTSLLSHAQSQSLILDSSNGNSHHIEGPVGEACQAPCK